MTDPTERDDTILMGAAWALIVSGTAIFIYLLVVRGTWWVPPLGTLLAGVGLLSHAFWRRWRISRGGKAHMG